MKLVKGYSSLNPNFIVFLTRASYLKDYPPFGGFWN
jgi:hypothetical protein